MKNFNTQIHIRVFLLVMFVVVSPYILCSSQEEEDILTAPIEENEQKALYYAIQGFVGEVVEWLRSLSRPLWLDFNTGTINNFLRPLYMEICLNFDRPY
ncbi:hypothetical protein ACSBR2_026518 [Camellia fascicularis]